MKSFLSLGLSLLTFCSFLSNATAQKTEPLIVYANKTIATVQSVMWGVFFEDINFAADGGIYSELVKNRSFEFYRPRTGWNISQTSSDSSHFLIINRGNANINNPRFARITLKKGDGDLSMTNSGFGGMGIKRGVRYNLSVMVSLPQDDDFTIGVEFLDDKGESIGSTSLTPEGSEWKKYEAGIVARRIVEKGSLRVWFSGTGVIDFDMVSLFPEDTWMNRPGGLRADLVQLLADLKPGFLRFPGGCIVEGFDLSVPYQWKKTLGNTEDRKMIVNRWNTEFSHRQTPDYYQTFGLGFFEYFQLAEDIGAEPLPILNCGMACQFNSAEVVPLDQMDPYVQDALNLIEFANGPADSRW